jgi:hypothetical protein
MRLYIDLPEDTIEKAELLALREDRFPKQQIEHLTKRAIDEAFRAVSALVEAPETSHVGAE